MAIATGTRLGQYEVQDFLGQGAMGVVYRAYHSELERTGAVKVMQAITPDPGTVARFRHEAQAIARLRHPNIVDVYDFGEFQGTPYMIVEYVPGGSLADRMSEGHLDQPTALRYLRGIAAGLDYAHGHGVVHRDVKPANVLLTADDSPVLADFGLAKLMQGSSLKSMTGVTTGTPAYMAPEQVTGGQVGPAADRYSLATIAYEMLTGVIPFDGEALMELLYAQVHRYPSPPSARHSALGPAVDAVIMRGLAKNPTERWPSCGAFVEALAAALAGEPAHLAAPTMVMAPPVARTKPVTRTKPVARTAVIDMAVPEDVELGQHVVKICWNNACHRDAMLRVVADAGEVLPSPSSGGSPGTSPSPGSSPSAGGSPRPSSTPTSSRTSPTPSSTATPTSPPTSTPKSSPTPPPTNPPPSITVTPTTVHILTSRKITVTGTYWPPGSTVTINYIQSGLVTTKIGNQNVQSDGSFSWTGNIPSSALPGSATIQVCSGSVCKSFGITVTT